MKKAILYIIFCGLYALVIFSMYENSKLPVIYWSVARDECYKIKIEGDYYPCSYIDLENDKYKKLYTGK